MVGTSEHLEIDDAIYLCVLWPSIFFSLQKLHRSFWERATQVKIQLCRECILVLRFCCIFLFFQVRSEKNLFPQKNVMLKSYHASAEGCWAKPTGHVVHSSWPELSRGCSCMSSVCVCSSNGRHWGCRLAYVWVRGGHASHSSHWHACHAHSVSVHLLQRFQHVHSGLGTCKRRVLLSGLCWKLPISWLDILFLHWYWPLSLKCKRLNLNLIHPSRMKYNSAKI